MLESASPTKPLRYNIVNPSVCHPEKIKIRREGMREVAITDVSAAGELEGRSNSNIRKKGSR
jgi:hypothetical protein